MNILKKLLELYRESLQVIEDETPNLTAVKIPKIEESKTEYGKYKEIKKIEKKTIEKPERGVVFELVPSLDAQEMRFVILDKNKDFITILPLSRWIEFATPKDVVVEIEGENYIVETDIPLDIPTEGFNTYFADSNLFEITQLNKETLEKIERVYRGTEGGDGKLLTREKEEFKKLEVKRYFPIWLGVINQSEEQVRKISNSLK